MKMNRFAAFALASVCSISAFAAPLEAFAEGYPFRTTCNYYYNQFDKNAKKLYDDLYNTAVMIDESYDTYLETPPIIYSGLTSKQFLDTMKMFNFDHPEFFWLGNTFTYGTSYKGDFVQVNIYTPFQSGSERQAAKKKIVAMEQEMIDGAMQYSTDYERAQYLSERLYQEVTYDEVAYSLDQSLASTFLYKTTVCAGFTKAYSLLANAVGVDTVALRSDVHAWNATKIAGVWYVEDVTNHMFLYCDDEVAAFDKRAGIQTVTYPDGKTKQSLMHDLSYEYYTDIFPDTSQKYNGDVMVLDVQPDTQPETQPDTQPETQPETQPATQPPTEPKTQNPTDPVTYGDTPVDDGAYTSDPVTQYCFADDDDEINPIMLFNEMQETVLDFEDWGNPEDFWDWDWIFEVSDFSDLTLSEGWRTPKEILAKHAAGKPYYHGPIQAEMNGHKLALGDVWIFRRGDFNMDGTVNAVDATGILICAAAVGAGKQPVTPSGKDADAALFAGKYLESSLDYPNASDATAVLVYAAKVGTGQVG